MCCVPLCKYPTAALLFLEMQTGVERAPLPINKPIMKIAELGLVGEVVPATVEQPPAPTLPPNAAATCTAGNFATKHREPFCKPAGGRCQRLADPQ